MYTELYDDNHQFIYTKNEWLDSDRIERRSSGEYDSNLLCKKCEHERLSKFEDYARTVLFGNETKTNLMPICRNYRNNEGIIYSNWQNIDYTKFKIFLLSILWRASISKRDIFSEVNLGIHEELLRKMILDETPGEVNNYPILFFGTQSYSKNFSKIIAQPRKLKQEGRTLYLFFIGGIMLLFYISKNKIPQIFTEHTIRPSNEVDIIQLPKEGIDIWFEKAYGIKNITKVL